MALLLASLLVAGCDRPPDKPVVQRPGDDAYARAYLTWWIPRRLAQQDVPGLSIALVDGGETVWSAGFGHADREQDLPADAQTIYRVGSLSKPLTAIAVLQQWRAGRLALDRPVNRLLPELQGRDSGVASPGVTLRRLLSHHSGLAANHLGSLARGEDLGGERITDVLLRTRLAYRPGTTYHYSNLGYSLLGEVLARSTGQPFPESMRAGLFEPLGMGRTGYGSPPAGLGVTATGYDRDGPGDWQALGHPAALGAYSSADDLGRLLGALFDALDGGGHAPLEAEAVDEMLRPQNLDHAADFDLRTGLGWFLSGFDLERGSITAYHRGGTRRFRSLIALLPERRLGVVVLCNAGHGRELVDEIGRTALRLAVEAKTGQTPTTPPPRPQPGPSQWEDGDAGRISGHYVTRVGLVTLSSEEDEVIAEALGRRFRLTPLSGGAFSADLLLPGGISLDGAALAGIWFQQRRLGERALIGVQWQGLLYPFGEKVSPRPVAPAWLRRQGRYRLVQALPGVDLGDIELVYAEGLLRARARVPLLSRLGFLPRGIGLPSGWQPLLELPILPLDDDAADVPAAGPYVGGDIQVLRQDGREQAVYSGLRLSPAPATRSATPPPD